MSLLEGLEGTPIGRGLEGLDPTVDWKGWKGRQLDPDVVAGWDVVVDCSYRCCCC